MAQFGPSSVFNLGLIQRAALDTGSNPNSGLIWDLGGADGAGYFGP